MSNTAVENPVKPRVRAVRRVITGHNAEGRSIVVLDGPSPHVESILGIATLASTELWATKTAPARNMGPRDPVSLPLVIAPPPLGSVFRVVEFPPDKDWKGQLTAGAGLSSSAHESGSGNPMMHRTKSLDYVVVITGEIWSILDEGEVLLRAGDVMVQRGTNHAWANRSDEPCVVAFILVDAEPIPGLDAH